MEQNWFRRIFSAGGEATLEATQIKADHGDADAQFGLGLKYASGTEGGSQDYAHAARWYRKAAEHNHALAQFNLATMYAEGQGVVQNADEAAVWFLKAASQGDAGAQFQLGMNHRRASFNRRTHDATESRIEAYKWLQLSAAQGYRDAAAACEQVNLAMNGDDVVEGNHRAALLLAAMPVRNAVV